MENGEDAVSKQRHTLSPKPVKNSPAQQAPPLTAPTSDTTSRPPQNPPSPDAPPPKAETKTEPPDPSADLSPLTPGQIHACVAMLLDRAKDGDPAARAQIDSLLATPNGRIAVQAFGNPHDNVLGHLMDACCPG